METTLHRQIKELYAGDSASTEVTLGDYRIDVVRDDELIEVQHGSLAALRDKVARLVKKHQVRVVKPIIKSKLLIKQDGKAGNVVARRRSPRRGSMLEIFDELVYFATLFPHRRLAVEVLLVEIEEYRYPGHGRRRRWRRRDHVVEDQKLLAVHERLELRTARDLRKLLPGRLPRPFHTGHLAERLQIDRWVAQRIAYCLRHAGTVEQVGKQGNALLYQFPKARRAA